MQLFYNPKIHTYKNHVLFNQLFHEQKAVFVGFQYITLKVNECININQQNRFTILHFKSYIFTILNTE